MHPLGDGRWIIYYTYEKDGVIYGIVDMEATSVKQSEKAQQSTSNLIAGKSAKYNEQPKTNLEHFPAEPESGAGHPTLQLLQTRSSRSRLNFRPDQATRSFSIRSNGKSIRSRTGTLFDLGGFTTSGLPLWNSCATSK